MAIENLPNYRNSAVSRKSKLDSRHLAPSLEAGTPPEDRRFRPDIQGLRAIAVLLVVLDHAGVTFFASGYIGRGRLLRDLWICNNWDHPTRVE